MLEKIGRFKVENGIIVIHNKDDEIELFDEIDMMPKKYLKELPEIKLEYDKKGVD